MMDGCNLPFHDGEFDCVFASEVFEHIFNLENILGELNRVLKPQGSMLITVPFVWNEHEIPYDFARYTSFGIVDLLHRTGFEIIELRKSTLYVETVATMVTEYVRLEITKRVRYGLIVRFLQIMFTVPILFFGLILGWVMPENDTWYCNNIIRCKKQE